MARRTPEERRARRTAFWKGFKEDLKWVAPFLFVVLLTGPIWGPPLLRVTGIAKLMGWSDRDAGYERWYGGTDGEEDLGDVTTLIFRQDGLVVPFEVLSILLLAALVAGVVIAFRDPEGAD